MPTPIPSGEINAFIAIVNVQNPQEALLLPSVLVNYEDVKTAIGRQLTAFAGYNQYLTSALGVFTNSALLAVGIYFNQTETATKTDVQLIVNSTFTGGGVEVKFNTAGIGILGTSQVNKIVVDTRIRLDKLYIGPGATVDVLDSTAANATVGIVAIAAERNSGGTLNRIQTGSNIGTVKVDKGATFGGYGFYDPTTTCAQPVTALAATMNTNDSLLLSWTLPASYLFITPYYRQSGSTSWLSVDETNGNFEGDTGFTFTSLTRDTYYDFQVITTCSNGGNSTPVQLLNQQTTCC